MRVKRPRTRCASLKPCKDRELDGDCLESSGFTAVQPQAQPAQGSRRKTGQPDFLGIEQGRDEEPAC